MIRGLTIFESEYSSHVQGHVDCAVFHLDVLGAEDVRLADAALEPADEEVCRDTSDPRKSMAADENPRKTMCQI